MLGSNFSEPLILVTKCHKSSSWVLGSFDHSTSGVGANVTVTLSDGNGLESESAIDMRDGPDENDHTKIPGVKNQCLFVTGWRVCFRGLVFRWRDIKSRISHTSTITRASYIRRSGNLPMWDRSSQSSASRSEASSSSAMRDASCRDLDSEWHDNSSGDSNNGNNTDADAESPLEVSMSLTHHGF